MRARIAILAVLITAGCGGDSPAPTAPSPAPSTTPPPAAPAPAPGFTGTVTDTISGAPVLGFTATVNGTRLVVSAPDYLTRDTRAGVNTVDLIPARGIDLDFYRQIARGSVDGALQPLRVLRDSPSFYMEVEGPSGLPMQTSLLVEQIIRRMVPELTGGVLHVVTFERGPTPRTPENGWIMIEHFDQPGICGQALVGATAGHIWLDGNKQCNMSAVVAHELGHALGFWHVNVAGSLMFPRDRASNIADAPTEQERRHTAIAYKRVAGNRDIDVDP